MTQSFTAAPARTSAADAPEILSVLRRYVWIVILGTIIGTVVGAGLYLYLRKTQPRYTATVTFQVLPPPLSPANLRPMDNPISTQEDVARFVKRQVRLVMDDMVLNRVLSSD